MRGASCWLGYAAVQIAHALGSRVIATTHRDEYVERLQRFGADEVVLDDGALSRAGVRAHKALELIGPKTLQDTLGCLWRGGICCDTGILGGVFTLDRFDPICISAAGRAAVFPSTRREWQPTQPLGAGARHNPLQWSK